MVWLRYFENSIFVENITFLEFTSG